MPILKYRGKSANPCGIGQAVFPTSSAGDGKLEVDGFYSCKQCGFWNDSSLVQSPGGTPDGNGGITVSGSDPIVSSFCAFCGSANNR